MKSFNYRNRGWQISCWAHCFVKCIFCLICRDYRPGTAIYNLLINLRSFNNLMIYLVFGVFFRHQEPFLLHTELFFRFVSTNNYLENLLYKNNTYVIVILDHLNYFICYPSCYLDRYPPVTQTIIKELTSINKSILLVNFANDH